MFLSRNVGPGRPDEACVLADFVRILLEQGRIEYPERPGPVPEPDRALAASRLESVHAVRRLELAGRPLPFDRDAALGAAEFLRRAGWYLVSRDEPDEEVDARLKWPGKPTTPGSHLSADLTLRFLPQILRRGAALELEPEDRLMVRVAEVLRRWPFSGVLAEMIDDGPSEPGALEFGGHRGLQMDYAERLSRNVRPAWFPSGGHAREVAIWIFEDLGRDVPRPVEVAEPGHDDMIPPRSRGAR